MNEEQQKKDTKSKKKILDRELLLETEGAAEDTQMQEEIAEERDVKTEQEEHPLSSDFESESEETSATPLHVLPLYSVLPTNQQLRVFEEVPEGDRLVVVATNVAETSLTIPGIKYVVDTGKVKELHYDKVTGINKFVITWTSQASANQVLPQKHRSNCLPASRKSRKNWRRSLLQTLQLLDVQQLL